MALVVMFMFSLIGLVAAIVGALGYDISFGAALMVYGVMAICGPMCLLPLAYGLGVSDPA